MFALLLLMAVAVSGQEAGTRSTHKVRVSDPKEAGRIIAAGGRLVADYGAFQILQIPAAGPALAAVGGNGSMLRDDLDVITLNAGAIDTAAAAGPARAAAEPLAAFEGKRLHLIHFAGPVKPEWVDDLRKTGVEVVTYLPSNAYLVYGDGVALGKLRAPAANSALATFRDWDGAYLDSYKTDPAAKTVDAAGNPRVIGTEYFAVQLVADEAANPATVAVIQGLATGDLLRSEPSLNYYNVIAPLPAGRLADIAARPDVISIQPYIVPKKFDERQDQIIAGNLAGSIPSGAGYLAWLDSKGFTQNQFTLSGFAVDVTDSGVDNGTPNPNHFGLYQAGDRLGISRFVYNRLEGTPHAGSSIAGVDGHGNLNAHIIGGFNNLTGAPHQDASGFRYGLGVAPYVRLGSSVIFDPNTFTSPSYQNLMARAYRDGARISSNSWGANTAGAYNTDAQSYDALVRDAQPASSSNPTAGNQGMVIVFANGNAGSGAGTVGSPGTAKNVISVGAAENVQAFGGSDGSGIGDTGADNANDIISFSSRGPCADGRKKPDIVAPGTHVSGGVWQTANPGPTGTADPLFDGSGVSGGILGSNFFPGNGSTQQFYTASSGTSHSTPCVAGGAAMVRQYFLNRNFAAPSAAMTKGFLMNSSRYLNGVGANDTLPSNNQGMGEMNLGTAFDGAARVVRDQLAADKFTGTGQTRVFNLTVVDSAKPLRITVAWTDAPGSTTGNAYKNDLDLTVVAGGNTYRGNVFAGANSVTGGTADPRNNVESVFLPAGISGAVTVTITASNINSDGVPNDADLLDQDFALVVYDALPPATASVLPNGATITAEGFAPANGLIDNNETVTVSFNLQNAGNTAIGNLVATLQNSGGVTAASGPQTYGALAVGTSVARPFTFTASGTPGGPLTATFNLTDGVTSLGSVTFGFSLAPPPPITVTSTVPAAGGVFTLPGPFTYDVNFSAPVDPASVQTGDLVLSGIGGASVSGVTVLPGNTTARFTLSGITTEGALTANIAYGVITNLSNVPVSAFTGTYQVDIGTVPFPTPLTAAKPPGSLIYGGSASGAINLAGDTDTFTLGLDPGQTITVNVTPTAPSLQPSVQLLNPASAPIGSGTAGAANQNALIQTVSTAGGGTYSIVVSGAGGTTGSYTVQVTLNAAQENEGTIIGVTNGTPGTAQNIDGTFTALPPGIPGTQRGAVLGTTDSAGYTAAAAGAAFEDISGTGTVIAALTSVDDTATTITPGFAFTFYGTSYSTYGVSSNGLITFGGTDSSFSNSDLTTTPTLATIAAFWDDLHTGGGLPGSNVFFQVLGSGANQHLTIQWNQVRFFSGGTAGDTLTFEVQLFADGRIQLNYPDLASGAAAGNNGGNATAGIKAAGTQGANRLLLAQNVSGGNAFVGTGKSTLISPPISGPDYYSFTLTAGETATVAATGQSAGVLSLELRDGADATLATGTGGSTNLTSVISNFTAPTAGTYYARITGGGTAPYSLVVTRKVVFDTEGNNTGPTAQSLGGNPVVLGRGAGGGVTAFDFESGQQGFTINNTVVGTGTAAGLWHLSTRRGAEAGHSASTSFYYGSEATGNFSTGARNAGTITSAPIVVGPGSSLTFNYVLQTEGNGSFDVASVLVSADNFATSTTLFTSTSAASLPLRSTWGAVSASLAAFSGQTVQIRFSFDTIDSISNAFEGWYVDDIQIASPSDDDWYSFNVASTGTPLVLVTNTPGDGPGEFVNTFNPHIELYDPSDTLVASGAALADGRNERLQHATLTTGTYRVRVSGEGGTSGEYILAMVTAPMVTVNPSSILVNIGANAAFTAAATGVPAPTVQWQESTDGGGTFNNLSDGGVYSNVTTPTMNITGATFAMNGYRYRAVFTNVAGIATTGAATLTVNRPPVAGAVSVQRFPTQGVKIPVSQLTGAATDPDPGDTISLFSVANGTNGTAQILGGFVFYTPTGIGTPGVNQNPDTFNYVIKDNHGAQATGSVTVNIAASPNAASLNITAVTLLPGGGVAVDFSGIPGYIYGLQFKVTLADPVWQNIAPVTADQFGRGHYVDGPPPVGSTSGFYRLVFPAPLPPP